MTQTCVYHVADAEGLYAERCGKPATHISCKPEKDSPTCMEHKCGCAKRIDASGDAAANLNVPGLTHDTVMSMLSGLNSQPTQTAPVAPPASSRVRDEVGTIAIVQALKELREVSLELGRALERERQLESQMEVYRLVARKDIADRSSARWLVDSLTIAGNELVHIAGGSIDLSNPRTGKEWETVVKQWNAAVQHAHQKLMEATS